MVLRFFPKSKSTLLSAVPSSSPILLPRRGSRLPILLLVPTPSTSEGFSVLRRSRLRLPSIHGILQFSSSCNQSIWDFMLADYDSIQVWAVESSSYFLIFSASVFAIPGLEACYELFLPRKFFNQFWNSSYDDSKIWSATGKWSI